MGLSEPDEALDPNRIDLSEFARAAHPGLSETTADSLSEAASVAFDAQKHGFPLHLRLLHKEGEQVELIGPVCSDLLRRTHFDIQEAIENGASIVGLAYTCLTRGKKVLARAPKQRNGYDYFLCPKEEEITDAELNFLSHSDIQVEVSGTSQKGVAEVKDRVAEKERRLKKYGNPGRFCIVVTSFSEKMLHETELVIE